MLEFNEEIKEQNNGTLEVKRKESSQINLKFITYRQVAESNERKLKEANSVIDQLKEEKATFQEMEKNLRSQIFSSHNRLIQMHDILKNMADIQEKQRENDNKSLQIETTIAELNEMIKGTRERSDLILEKTQNDLRLIEKINEFKNKLRAKELEYDLIKMELHSLQKEKKELEIQVLQNKTLENEIEKSKKEIQELKADRDATLLIYKKQLAHNDQIIRDYERERKILLEEFELPKDKIIVENNFDDFTWADSTVSINREESSHSEMQANSHFEETELNSQSRTSQLIKENNFDISLPHLSIFSKSKRDDSKKSVEKFEQNEKSGSQVLNSFTQTKQQEIPSCRIPPKRKLYSTNCNHYLF